MFMKLGLNLKSNHANGVAAENLACEHLRQLGYSISHIRYKCKHGEIDIIAEKPNLLIFVEVKHRKNFGEDDPISLNQKKRIINTALHYLSIHPEKNELDMRFDSIMIAPSKIDTNKLSHIEDAWRIE